jgi:Tfp pilus assembly protein PilV
VEQAIIVAGDPPRNRARGQVIVVVLLIAVPLLGLLVIQQGRVIETQRVLIRQLNSDSQQLNAMRMRESQNHAKQASPPATTPQAQRPDTQQQPGASSEQKNSKRREKKQASPPAVQEYPASRPVPTRKSV